MEGGRAFYGWKLLGVLFLLDFLNMGAPYFGGAVINTYMLRQITMSRSTFGLGFTLVNLLVGALSVVAATTILKWGIRITFAIGSALLVAGALWLAYFTKEPQQYLAGFGVLIGAGISFGTLIPVTTCITRWFRKYRGRTMGLALSASGFAGLVGSPLINKFLTVNGGNWRQAWQVVAGVAVLSGIIAYVFVKERPEDLGQRVDGALPMPGGLPAAGNKQLVSNHHWSVEDALNTKTYWLIVVGGVACQFPYFFFIAHGILHMKGEGLSAATAAWVMGLFTMGAILGRQIGGWLMDKIAARAAFIMGLCCYFAGSLLSMRSKSVGSATAAAILYGTAFGWSFVCLNTSTSHFFGVDAFPRLNGINLLVTGLLSSPAGYVGGRIFDRYQNYRMGFELNMLIAAVGILALVFATMPQPKTPVQDKTTSQPIHPNCKNYERTIPDPAE
jgi:MFS family permease